VVTLSRRALLGKIRIQKSNIDDAEDFLWYDRLELGRLLIEGVERGIPVAEMARTAGLSRETVNTLMRKYWQGQHDEADLSGDWDRFEEWLAGLQPSTRRLLEG
jgi:hypothetical protein